MNVALVYPEVYDLGRFREKRKEFPPFGVLYLAAVMEKDNHFVKVFRVSPGNESLDLRGYDAIAFSISSSATYDVVRRARFNSMYDGDPITIIGGVHVNFYPKETFEDFEVDVAGVDECEETILEILAKAKNRDFETIPGVVYRNGTTLVRTPSRSSIIDINFLPLPARHLLPAEDLIMSDRLAGTEKSMAHVMLSRGCPFPCRFCAAAQTRMQYRSGASARLELVHLVERYGIEGFAIVDDNFIVQKRKVASICESIEDLQLEWSALSRVDTVDDDLLRRMRKSGCIEIKFGIESGSQKILNAMRKNITPWQIKNALLMAQRAGIRCKVFVIHGYPGEDMATTMETVQILEDMKDSISRVSLFRFVPLPGTFVYENSEEFQVRGTHRSADWTSDWSRFHIHHNCFHWWGTEIQFQEVCKSFDMLSDYVSNHWPSEI